MEQQAQDIPVDTSDTAPADPNTVVLETPIVRGNQVIASLALRKPKVSDLRGISLVELAQLDVGALEKILPRIASPFVTDADVRAMDIADLVQAGTIVAGFLLPKSAILA